MAIFLDLLKSSDTVQHELLLFKREKIGFRRFAFNWLQTYLSNRYRYVSLQEEDSDKKTLLESLFVFL